MITDPRYWPALIGSFLMDLPAMGGPFKVWPMKAASVLFGCVGVAGSAQEEDEVCEDIFAEKCSANYSFWQFWNPSSLYTTFDALGNHHKTRFLPLLYRASLIIIILPISVQLFISL